MSNSSLAKLTKTSLVFPTSVHETIDRFNSLRLITAFFFGEVSILPQSLLALTNWCENNKALIQTRILMDTEFLVKFMLCVDDRIHQWLRQCCTAKMITDTAVRLLDFREICRTPTFRSKDSFMLFLQVSRLSTCRMIARTMPTALEMERNRNKTREKPS